MIGAVRRRVEAAGLKFDENRRERALDAEPKGA
jgi:hypothetical protein